MYQAVPPADASASLAIGIDALTFYCPPYYLDLKTLARHRGVPWEKFYNGIGQEKMTMAPPDEDVVTMAANAALAALTDLDRDQIDTVIFATESGIDQSKAAAIYVHKLLGLPARCRAFEVKQACCSSTMAVQMAMGMVAMKPRAKVLVVASDVARYGLGTPGEATQGAGAAAIVIAANPRLIVLEPESGSYTEDVMDFWRPNYLDQALVDGKFSMRMYIKALTAAWEDYRAQTGREFRDLHRFVYHLPFTRMAEKAHAALAKLADVHLDANQLAELLRGSLHYGRLVGNCYTASLYISLLSLLDNAREDLGGQQIGFFSYGSGCVGIFFSGRIQPGYRDHLHRVEHYRLLTDRQELDWSDYLAFYHHELPTDGSEFRTGRYAGGPYRLAGIADHQRIYEVVEPGEAQRVLTPQPVATATGLSAIGV